MNERIKELEKQCWTHRVDGALVDGQLHFDTEKFAELIIRRVIARIENWAEDDFGLNALAIEILDEFDMELKDEE